MNLQEIYVEVVHQAARQNWTEAKGIEVGKKDYFQGQKNCYRIILALIAEEPDQRESWQSLQESAQSGYVSRLAAAKAKAQRASELLGFLQLGERLSKRDVQRYLDWHECTKPKGAEDG